MNDDRWHWKIDWVRDIDDGYEKNSFFKGKKLLDLQDIEDYLNELETLIKETHDKMDDNNAESDGVLCHWCAGYGYDANGQIHDEDCILVRIRRVLS